MIWLVRHGQTELNRELRLQGRLDSPLTELGVAQATRVGAWFAGRMAPGERWRLVASPLGRTRRTAAIIGEATGLAPEIDERLIELSIGSWEGLARHEIEGLRPDLAGQAFFMHSQDGEAWASAAERLGAVLADHGGADENVITVCHAGAGKVMRALHLGLDIEAARALDTPQDAVYRLGPGAAERFDCA